MTSRERVRAAMNFEKPDRLPKDLGGMRSTGISAFAYPALVEALGLPPRRTRVHDTGQMLALPDMDVLDALGCDVVTIDQGITNTDDWEGLWHPYDFNGRLNAAVRWPGNFRTGEDGTIYQGASRMPPSAVVFNVEHAGCPMLDFDAPLPLMDLKKYKADLDKWTFTDKDIEAAVAVCKRARDASDKAIFYTDHFDARIAITAHGGIAVFPVICLLEPQYVMDYHAITIEAVLRNMRLLLPEVAPYVDIIKTGGDDWGTQNATIAPPETFRTLFAPFYKQVNDEAHRIAPGVKTFIHTCGAIFEVLDMMAGCGFDIINPIQWTAGGHSYREWKDKLRKRSTMWGGGVSSQRTLAFGTIEEIEREVKEVCAYLSVDGGFVFTAIHNLLAEVTPDKVIAIYRAADTTAV